MAEKDGEVHRVHWVHIFGFFRLFFAESINFLRLVLNLVLNKNWQEAQIGPETIAFPDIFLQSWASSDTWNQYFNKIRLHWIMVLQKILLFLLNFYT